MSGLDFAAAKALPLSSIVGATVKLRRAGREMVACCPFHPEKSASFTVNDDKGFYHCFGCGAHGDAADFIAAVEGVDLREALARIGAGDLPQMRSPPVPSVPDRDTVQAARVIWRSAGPIGGTASERYLRGRGISCSIPPTFRHAQLAYGSGGDRLPCMVALVTGDDGALSGIQRTYLTDAGTKAKVPTPKLSLGRVSGGAIRLAPVAAEVVVCEGAEDGLSLQQELGRAVWVAAGASMLAGMRFPPAVRSIVIGADNDVAGEREAAKAAAVFTERGLRVRIMRPPEGFKDFNETLTMGRAAA